MEAVNNNPTGTVNKGGRPRRYKTVQELENAIEDYFTFTRTPVFNKLGEVSDYKEGPYTMSGLAYHLGFTSRRALLNYNKYNETGEDEIGEGVDNPNGFLHAINRARLRVQSWVESMGYDKDGCRNVPFMLSNNFPEEGWTQKQEISNTVTVVHQLDPADWEMLEAKVIEARKARMQLQEPVIDAEFEPVHSAIHNSDATTK